MKFFPLGPTHKWGVARPWYWRVGDYACGCHMHAAEFPNYHLRNAHDVRFHPEWVLASKRAGEMMKSPTNKYTSQGLSTSWRIWRYLWLSAQGWWMFFTRDLPRWL